MAPSLLVLAGALAALGVVAGDAHWSLPAHNGNGLYSLRGGRRLQGDYCNTIGCPAGYTPIVDAQFVECDGTCEESQCCEAFCSYHACPNNYIPIEDAVTTACDASGCTDALCCESGMSTSAGTGGSTTSFVDDVTIAAGITTSDSAGVYCNSIACPDGYTPIDDAQSTVCDGDTCEESQCCEAFCSYHACPNNYIPIEDAVTTACADSGCTDALCCESVMSTSAGTGGSTTSFVDDVTIAAGITTSDSGGVYCNSIACPDGYTPIDDAQSTVCDGDTCEESQCCEAFCSYHACPNNYLPTTDAATTLCADSGCTDDLCCESWTEIMTTSNANDDDFSYTFSAEDSSSSGSSDDSIYSYSFN